MKDSFADTLKQFRTEKNLSQQQLADMLFVERTTIANWETGRRIPDAVLLLRISKMFRYGHQHFIGNDRQHRRGTKHHYG